MFQKRIFNKTLAITTMGILSLSLSACGEFSYKRGASVRDFQQEKNVCAASTNTEAQTKKCLKENGWIVLDLDNKANEEAAKTGSPANKAVIHGSYTKSSPDQFIAEKTTDAEIEPAPLPTDPLQPVGVSSWWKAGAGPDQLLAEGQVCKDGLSKEHPINGNFSQVTVGFIECMAEKGWKVWLK